jgi:hypothetical protein
MLINSNTKLEKYNIITNIFTIFLNFLTFGIYRKHKIADIIMY